MNIFKDGNHFESANLFCWRTVLLEIEVCHLFFFKHIRKLCTHLSCLAPKNVTSGRTIPRWLSSFARRHKNMAHYKFLHLYCNCFSALKFIMPQWFSICIHFLMSQNNYFSQFFTTEYVPYPSVILDGRFCLFIQSLMLSGNQISSAN